jgi:putative transposase
MQSAPLPAIKAVRPDYRDLNAQVVQDVLHRLDTACAAFFRRLQAGEHPGYLRLQGTDRYHSFTYPQVGAHGGHGGAALDGACSPAPRLTDSASGCIRLRLHRPLEGTPKVGHHQPRGRRVVRVHRLCCYRLCGRAQRTAACDGP